MSVQVGQTWRDKRVDGQPGYRRLVAVSKVQERYVYGVGRYQMREGEQWRDASWPNVRRKTRVLLVSFLRDYEQVEIEGES